MAKKTRHKKHEEHIDESWLIPYADILTLLLAVFVILFASSTVNEEKLDRLSQVFSSIFESGSGIMDYAAPVESLDAQTNELKKSGYEQDQEQLAETQGRVEELIAINELENQLETQMTSEGLLITIRDSVLFAPGSADINPEYASVA